MNGVVIGTSFPQLSHARARFDRQNTDAHGINFVDDGLDSKHTGPVFNLSGLQLRPKEQTAADSISKDFEMQELKKVIEELQKSNKELKDTITALEESNVSCKEVIYTLAEENTRLEDQVADARRRDPTFDKLKRQMSAQDFEIWTLKHGLNDAAATVEDVLGGKDWMDNIPTSILQRLLKK